MVMLLLIRFILSPSGNKSTGLDPDVTMMGVARHKAQFFSHSLFYEQAAAGTLPAFTWISPAHEAADHPCLDIAKGERLLKDVYEAVRNGKNLPCSEHACR